MPVILKIPLTVNASRPRFPVLRFSAPFAGGQYSFNQPGNTNVTLMRLKPNSLYLLAAYSFFANVGEADWLASMDTQANFPAFQLNFKNGSTPSIYPDPLRCVNYVDNADQLIYFDSGRSDDILQISFSGIVNQVAGMVGIDPLLAEVNLNIYQIMDQEFIKEYNGLRLKQGEVGNGL